MGDVATAFVRAAETAGKRCCFCAVENRVLDAAGRGLHALQLGEQPTWDPRDWPRVLASKKSLREQLRRARAKGVSVRELTTEELEAGGVRDAITDVTSRWLSMRRMAPMGFLVQIEPFIFLPHRRWFAAEIDGRLVGVAGVIPVPARKGWFLKDLVRDPEAPNGTGELLIDTVMRWAAAADCSWVTLGLAPLAGSVAPPLRFARRMMTAFYDFEGLALYKAKLRPNAWSTIHLAYPTSQGKAGSLLDALTAFASGNLVGFAMRSLFRRLVAMTRMLAELLPLSAILGTLGRRSS
jgi:phosphatidylglycerol lysyltransferase